MIFDDKKAKEQQQDIQRSAEARLPFFHTWLLF